MCHARKSAERRQNRTDRCRPCVRLSPGGVRCACIDRCRYIRFGLRLRLAGIEREDGFGVAVIAAGARTEHLPVLSRGDRVVIDSAGAGTLQHGVNLAEITAWTQRQLVFHHRPLGEVADEFNRYNAGRIEIRSPALREQEAA